MKLHTLLLIILACTTPSLFASRCIRLPVNITTSAPEKKRLTLDDALKQALSQRSNLKNLHLLTKSQRNLSLAALSGYLPQVGVTSVFQKAKNDAVPLNQQGIEISQLLFSFAGPVEQYRIQKHGTRIAELNELLQRDAVQLETETTFLNLYLLHKRVAPIRSFEVSAKADVQKTLLSNDLDLLSSFSFESGKAQFDYAVSTLFNYEEQVMIATTDLTKAIETEAPFTIDMLNAEYFVQKNLGVVEKHDETFFKEAAHQLRKELAIQTEQIAQLEKLKQFQEKSYLPSISLFANIATGEPALGVGIRQLPGAFWAAGLQFNWNFDGLGNAHRAAAEEAALQAAIFEKRNKELSIDQEVSNAYHELQQLNKNLAATCSDQSPEEQFLQQKKRYEVGDISETEYKQALFEWDKAQYAVYDQQVKTVLKYRELLAKSGYPNLDNPSSTQSTKP